MLNNFVLKIWSPIFVGLYHTVSVMKLHNQFKSYKNPVHCFTSLILIFRTLIPVAALGYNFHAGSVKPNVLEQVNPEAILSIMANVLITSHLLFAFVIIQNPIAQRVEIPFNVSEFGIKRVAIRTMVSVISMDAVF